MSEEPLGRGPLKGQVGSRCPVLQSVKTDQLILRCQGWGIGVLYPAASCPTFPNMGSG